MKYDFLKDNIEKGVHEINMFPEEKLVLVEEKLLIPIELKEFYSAMGYGFFFLNGGSINRFLDPNDFVLINLRQEYYEFDPDLEYYKSYTDRLIFFEVNEGVYLLIEKEDKNGRNAIYYFDEKIADSLDEFLHKFNAEGHYFEKK